MHAEFNSVVLFTALYLRFQHCAKDMSMFTAQPTILEFLFQPRMNVSKVFVGGNLMERHLAFAFTKTF